MKSRAASLRRRASSCSDQMSDVADAIAEMIATKVVSDLMRAAADDFGQDWLFGKPQPKPEFPGGPAASLRRSGLVE